jgi:predicted alpha/beta-hydrolase family hydrolase
MAELDEVTVPVLVVQGERDPFGRPAARSGPPAGRDVVLLPGDHSLKAGLEALERTVGAWLSRVSA